jgi:NADH-quinone oxidoreductase subunit N
LAVLMSAVSLYYYFRIVLQMYLRDGEDVQPATLVTAPWVERVIWVCAIAVLVIGLAPAPFLSAVQTTVALFSVP